MLSTRSRFRVLSEMKENELAELSQYSTGDVESEKAQMEARRDKRRMKITKELFETEKTYLNHLELVNKHFDFPLRFNCLVPEGVHGKIFSNIEQIMEVNKTLLEYMEQTTVGEAFKYLGPFLKLYSSYANNHENALATIQEWQQKSPGFASFIKQQEEKPEIMGLKLNALLITPVQRIPRYKLLLEDLLENTPAHHHDYDQLKEAVKQTSEIASHINDHIRQHENFQKMLSIQKCFDNSAPKILAPGRVFIREGVLRKVSRKGSKSHDRMFFLFSDMLIYGKPKFLDSGNNSYSCCCVLPVKHCQVTRVFGNCKKDDRDGGGMFKITCRDENLLLYSNDPEDVTGWITDLESAIKKLCNNRSTLRKPSSHKHVLRGKSLWRLKRQEKEQDQKIKQILNPVKEESCFNSPSIKEGLSPLRNRLKSLSSDLDISKCRSPNKRPRIENNQSSTPVTTSKTRSGKPIRPPSFEIPQLRHDERLGSDDVFDGEESIACSERLRSESGSEASFMQVTMDDIGNATVQWDSFCKASQSENRQTDEQNKVYYTQSYKRTNEGGCGRQPLQRILNSGRGMRKRCRRALESAQQRIQETKTNCSIQ